MPKSPRRYADITERLIVGTTPRRRAALKECRITTSKRQLFDEIVTEASTGIMKEVEDQTTRRKMLSSYLKHAKLITKMSFRAMARKLKVGANTLARVNIFFGSRQLRSDKVSLAVQNTVKAFFLREDISRPLPDKRYTKTAGPAPLLQPTFQGAYDLRSKENPGLELAHTKYCSLKPRNVHWVTSAYLEVS